MKLILRLLTPPRSLTMRKYAAIDLPIAPYAEAGPLYGLVLPILISPSVAPASYFFCAAAGNASAATRDAARTISVRFMAGPPSGTIAYRCAGDSPARAPHRRPRWASGKQR